MITENVSSSLPLNLLDLPNALAGLGPSRWRTDLTTDRRSAALLTRFSLGICQSLVACLSYTLCLCLLVGVSSVKNGLASELGGNDETFSAYREEAIKNIEGRRIFVRDDTRLELSWNAPQEWRPPELAEGARAEKGILLVHGLGDSPWSFHDIGPELALRGFLVRTVLLPGHGTHPKDLLEVTVDDWRLTVKQQAEALQRDVVEVYLGGFSTGGNLVVEYAYANSAVAGLLLISPGFKSMPFDWLAPAVAAVRPWIVRPDEDRARHNEVRYMMVPTNGFAQYYYSSRRVRRLLASATYNKPVMMIVAQNDSVLDTDFLLSTFSHRFPHPASRLIWYGKAPRTGLPDRVVSLDDYRPDLKISQFSHMSMLFSPDNFLYGAKGQLKLCLNGQGDEAAARCKAGDAVWFSDWGYREKGKIHARLTFNPYFAWQADVIGSVLGTEAGGRR
jgi:esterase/lipase